MNEVVNEVNAANELSVYELISLIIAILAAIQPWIMKWVNTIKNRRQMKRDFEDETLYMMKDLLHFVIGVLNRTLDEGLPKIELILYENKYEAQLKYRRIKKAFDTKVGKMDVFKEYRDAAIELLEETLEPFREHNSYSESAIITTSLIDIVKNVKPNYYEKKSALELVKEVNIRHSRCIEEKWEAVIKVLETK